ncbi:hypothetical protein KIN20_022493 [Parelaphostrongylus tenuis]|uniref:Uncharacterized protein n=1 Tax=Parelaphostrongylus tenuis TaxID=148309 RepID=A0AAD5MVL2_PARTN|nr:hypothetical protein KIN20_022493 [Parelaphostrongylus tenuis]
MTNMRLTPRRDKLLNSSLNQATPTQSISVRCPAAWATGSYTLPISTSPAPAAGSLSVSLPSASDHSYLFEPTSCLWILVCLNV